MYSIVTWLFIFAFLQKMMLSFHEEEEGLPESFLSNFPSLIKVDIQAKVTDPSVAKSMMGCLLSSLKANGMGHIISNFIIFLSSSIRLSDLRIFRIFTTGL